MSSATARFVLRVLTATNPLTLILLTLVGTTISTTAFADPSGIMFGFSTEGPAGDSYHLYFYDADVAEHIPFTLGPPFTSSGVTEPATVPGSSRVRLLTASPNPFSRATDITIAVDNTERASLSVYSVDGRLVRTLARGVAASGLSQVTWDGRLDNGLEARAGIYFISLTAGEERRTVKVVKD